MNRVHMFIFSFLCICFLSVFFQTILLNMNDLKTDQFDIDRTLTCTTTPDESGHWNNNESVPRIPQISRK